MAGEVAVVAKLQDQVSPGLVSMARNATTWGRSMLKPVADLQSRLFSLKTALTGLAAVWGARIMGNFVGSTAEANVQLSITAQRVNATVESLSALNYAAGTVGMKHDQVADALKDFTLRLGDALKGTEAQAKAFRTLGIDVKALAGQQLDLVEVFGVLADGLKETADQGAKARLLMDLFGESSIRLLPLLAQGREGVKQWAEEAKKFGVTSSEAAVQVSQGFVNAKMRFGAAVQGVKDAILLQFYPALAKGLESLAGFLARNRDAVVDAVGDMARFLIETFGSIAKMVFDAAETLRGVRQLLGLTTEEENAQRAKTFALTRQIIAAEKELQELQERRSKGGPGWDMAMGYTAQIQALQAQLNVLRPLLAAGASGAFAKERAAIDRTVDKLKAMLDQAKAIAPSTPMAPFQLPPEVGAKAASTQGLYDYLKYEESFRRQPLEGFAPATMGQAQGQYNLEEERQGFEQKTKDSLDMFLDYTKDVSQMARDSLAGALSYSTDIMTQGFMDMVTGAKSAKDAFKDMAVDMLKMMAQMLIKMALMRAVGGIFGGIFGGAGATGGNAVLQLGGGVPSGPSMAGGGAGGADFGGGPTGGSRLAGAGNVTVNFNVLANDTRGFDELLARRRGLITQIIRDALQRDVAFRTQVAGA